MRPKTLPVRMCLERLRERERLARGGALHVFCRTRSDNAIPEASDSLAAKGVSSGGGMQDDGLRGEAGRIEDGVFGTDYATGMDTHGW